MSELFAFLASIHPLPDDLVHHLHSIVREQLFRRKTLVVRTGQLSQHVYFVRHGLLRSFYNKNEKEISSNFIREGQLCFPIEHIFQHPYGMETIEALEDTHTQIIPLKEWQAAYAQFPIFRTIGLRLMEQYIRDYYQRFRNMWIVPAQDRYHWLEEEQPQLCTRVQGRLLASYLGITPVMLSRLRSTG